MKDQKLSALLSFDDLINKFKDHKRDKFITEYHKSYFKTSQIKDWLPLTLFFIGIALYCYYFIGLVLIISEFHVWYFPGWNTNLALQLFLFIYWILIFAVSKVIGFDKWNWVKVSIFWTTFFIIILSVLFFLLVSINFPQWNSFGVDPNIFHYLIMISGMVWGPALILFFIVYVGQTFITEFGGVHLCLGWIYYLANQSAENPANDDFNFLSKSFKRLISELENWLKRTYRLNFHKKDKIVANFIGNLFNEKNFLEFHSDKQNIFEVILLNKPPESELSFPIVQKIIELVKDVSTKKKIKLKTISGSQIFVVFISKFYTYIISIAVFLINTFLGLSLTL